MKLTCPVCGKKLSAFNDTTLPIIDYYYMKCMSCGWETKHTPFCDEAFVEYEKECGRRGRQVKYTDTDAHQEIEFEFDGKAYIERPVLKPNCLCGTELYPVIKVQEQGEDFAGFTAVCPVCSRRVRGMNYLALERRWDLRDYDYEPSENIMWESIEKN